jgi:aminoglycoside 3-N-acetyltransferase I
MSEVKTARLTAGDRDLARQLFAMMARVFEEPNEALSDTYLDRLLGRRDFWALAALQGDEVVGGVTAHALPMTRAQSTELFIYDVAVRPDHQRRGIGRQLLTALRAAAVQAGIGELFVPADNEDTHALDFYRAVGGSAAAVTIFTFAGGPPASGGQPKAARSG